MDEQEKKNRITFGTFLLMIIAAAFFDILDLIPLLNIVVDVAATAAFMFWFTLQGVSPISPKRLITTGAASISQFFPLVSSLPLWIGYVIVMCLMTVAEDRVKSALKVSGGIKGPSLRRPGGRPNPLTLPSDRRTPAVVIE